MNASTARATDSDPTDAPQPEVAQPAPEAPASWPLVDRRSGRDRRERPTRWFDSLLGHRRRRRGRRRGESRNIYVDIFHARDLVLVAVVFLLNLADAVLTLHHLAFGAVEQNPLMDDLIARGPTWFILEKCFVVGLCLVALLVHKTFTLARRSAYVLLVFYGLLMLQHIALL